VSALSELLVEHLPEGWSYRRVAREARQLGHGISDATVTAYLGGRHGNPEDGTLAVLAETLQIPLARLRTVAGLPADPGTPWVPPAESARLDHDQRKVLDALVKVMARDAVVRAGAEQDAVGALRAEGAVGAESAAGTAPAGQAPDLALAARPGTPAHGPDRTGEESQDPDGDAPDAPHVPDAPV
jgi:hypothetical protein